MRFERGPDGYYHKVSDSRDPYPRIVTGQYRPGEPPRILDETDDEPVLPRTTPDEHPEAWGDRARDDDPDDLDRFLRERPPHHGD